MPTADRASEALRAAGLRVTAARLAVLAVLDGHPHSDVDAIAARVRARVPVSTQAVYDVLRALGEAGLVRRLVAAGPPARFETRTGDNHHHLVCRGCGAIVDVDCSAGRGPCLHPADDHGFAVDEAEVTFWGRCPRCQADAERHPTGPRPDP